MRLLSSIVALCCCWVTVNANADDTGPELKDIKSAIGQSIPLLEKAAAGSTEHRQCFTCHGHAMPILALVEARDRGFRIDDENLQAQLEHTAADLARGKAGYLEGRGQGGGHTRAGYALWCLHTAGWKPNDATAAAIEFLMFDENAEHWRSSADRPPSERSPFASTYAALRGLEAYGTEELAGRIDARKNKVLAWLLREIPLDTEDRVFRLLALHHLNAEDDAINVATEQLIATQQDDGGWAQIADAESDAYATGSALFALHQAAGMPSTNGIYRQGLRFLLRSQFADGSWHVRSRSKPFQTYYESGFPHGTDQFISMHASSWATLALLFACATTPDEPSARPGFLVIVTDDQRPDTIAALGNPHISTPNLDRLVRDGMTFTRATCAFPLCVPSRAEILTGATSFRNGVPFDGGRLKRDMVFWADALRDAGYHTWYSGKWMNDGSPQTRGYDETSGLFSSGGAGDDGRKPRYGRNGRLITGHRGWTFKTDDGQPELSKGIGLTGETSRHIADGAIALLERRSDKPFFLHVNFTAPHDPLIIPPGTAGKYDPAQMPSPENFLPRHPFDHGAFEGRDENLLPWPRTEDDIREEIAAYYAVIDDMDTQIGRILKTLEAIGQYDNTVIIFTSDHGLALGSHGLMGKQNMYEHTIGVPFIIAGPGIPRGGRTTAQIYLRDMFPTTCELAGVPIPESVSGRSLVPVLEGTATQIRPAVYGYYFNFQRMIRTERWKLIRYPQLDRQQLYDLRNDPTEQVDLATQAEHANQLADLSARMDQWFREQGDPLTTTTPDR